MAELKRRALTPHAFHGAWNYTLRPADTGPAADAPAAAGGPAPPPAPARPARRDQATLSALTGLPRPGLDALAGSLDIPLAARREQHPHARRGGPRRRPSWAGRVLPSRKLDHAGHVLAAVPQLRHGLPAATLAPLFGASPDTVSHAIKITRELPAQAGITIPPGPAQLRTLADLRGHAAAAGLTLPPLPGPAGSTNTAPIPHTQATRPEGET